MNKPVFLFPAFVLKYKGNEPAKDWPAFNQRLELLSQSTGIDLRGFDIKANNFLGDELKNQLMTYLFSCIYNDILREKNIEPAALSGLSMGLYAALYAAGSLGFEEGAILIRRVFEQLTKTTKEFSYGMLAVIGLNKDDIVKIMDADTLNCEAVIKNSDNSWLLSGKGATLEKFAEKARELGALHITRLPVNIPYHASFMPDMKLYKEQLLKGLNIQTCHIPVFSCTSMKYISKIEEVGVEICSNINSPIDWQAAMIAMQYKGTTTFYECGPGNSLVRMSKFIEGNFVVKSP